MMVLKPEDRSWVEQRAGVAGFHLSGVGAVPAADEHGQVFSGSTFSEWIAAGHAGEMEYLKRTDAAGNLIRSDVRRTLPWARSIVVCAMNYNVEAAYSVDPAPAGAGWIARYAWAGRAVAPDVDAGTSAAADYHDVLLPRLEVLAADLRGRFGGELLTRCYVDTGPILERDYAARAGIGWIGRNTCVINQQQGSWLLLGVIVTSLEVSAAAGVLPAADRCGSCTRCIDACPTAALPMPRTGADSRGDDPRGDDRRTMDASRCIAYLTIEHKGSIAEELRAPMGRQVFGCDICQEVCPWNGGVTQRRPAPPAVSPLPPRHELINPPLAWLASLDGPSFNRWFRGSPLERTRRRRVLRNVAIAMGNSGDTAHLPQLEAWAAVASAGGSTAADGVLAEAAAWAIARLREQAQLRIDAQRTDTR